MDPVTEAALATVLSSVETLVTHPAGFGLKTITPVQRAVCRVIDGNPLGTLAAYPDVAQVVGGADVIAKLPNEPPSEFLLYAGIRGAKSTIAAACAIRAAWTCDLSLASARDEVMAAIVSVNLKAAKPTWTHVRKAIEYSPVLRAILIGDPHVDSLTVRHRSGRPVEIRIAAGGRAATNLVSRWLACLIGDEAPRMQGSDEAVANLDDVRHVTRGRMLPGAQTLLIGSPWAPTGPMYDLFERHWQRPTRAIVCMRATGPQMNPLWWTPERCEKMRDEKPDAYRVDVLCEFLAPESSMFDLRDVEACRREGPAIRAPQDGWSYCAAMDPATRGNAWTLVIVGCSGTQGVAKKYTVCLCNQWIGAKDDPLDADGVLREIAELCKLYRVDVIDTDQWSNDALRALALHHGVYLREVVSTGPWKVEAYQRLQFRLKAGLLELPPDPQLKADLLAVRRRVTQNSISIEIGTTSDGRHGDYAPALALACMQELEAPPLPKFEGLGPREREAAAWEERIERRRERDQLEEQDRAWEERRDWPGFDG